MAYARPAGFLEVNPLATVLPDALVFAFGKKANLSIGRKHLPLDMSSGIVQGDGVVTFPGGTNDARILVLPELSLNSSVFTRVFSFSKPANADKNISFWMSTSTDNGSGYINDALEIFIEPNGQINFIKSSGGNSYPTTPGVIAPGLNTLALCRRADRTMDIAVNGVLIGTMPAADFVFGRELFGRANWKGASAAPTQGFDLYWYVQSPSVVTQAQLISLSNTPTQMMRVIGTGTGLGNFPALPEGTPTPKNWRFVGSEYQEFTVAANTNIRYGITGQYIEKTLSGTFVATNSLFGADPAPGLIKYVEAYLPVSPATSIVLERINAAMPVGTAGQTFAVTTDGYVSEDVTVTINGNGINLSPNPFALSLATGSVNVVPTSPTAGISTLTVTNNHGLNNPAPVTITRTQEIVRLVSTLGEFVAAAAEARTFDCVAAQQNFFIRATAAFDFSGALLRSDAANNEDFHIVFEPLRSLSHTVLDSTGAYTHGTLGMQMNALTDGGLALGRGVEVRDFRFNVTTFAGIRLLNQGQGIPTILRRCKILCNGFSSLHCGYYHPLRVRECLFTRTAACGGDLIEGQGRVDAQGSTFVLFTGGTASRAYSSDSSGASRGNIYSGFTTPISGGFFGDTSFSDTGGGSGITVAAQVVVNRTSDFRPFGPALGAAPEYFASTQDARKKNRGFDPDAGAVQAVPADDLAEINITTQSLNTSTGKVTIAGTFAGNITSAFAQIDPKFNSNGNLRQGPVALTFNNTAKTLSGELTIPRDLWKRLEVRGLNDGGTGPAASGTTTIENFPKLILAASANPASIQPNYWHPRSATGNNRKVELRRMVNSVSTIIGTYTEIGDLLTQDSRGGNPPPILPGDEIWVYPARYYKAVFFGGFDWGKGTERLLENVKVIGLTINGERPVIYWDGRNSIGTYELRSDFGYQYPLNSASGVLYVANNKNCSWENIDLICAGGFLDKALVYINNIRPGTVAFKNMRIHGAYQWGQNGVLSSHSSKCGLTFENVDSAFNGGAGGRPPAIDRDLSHAYYLSRHHPGADGVVPLISFIGCTFRQCWRGHLLKTRHNNMLVQGCYFMGVPGSAFDDPAQPSIYRNTQAANVAEVSAFDMPEGGTLTFVNNTIVKSYTGFDNGLFFINYGAETRYIALGSTKPGFVFSQEFINTAGVDSFTPEYYAAEHDPSGTVVIRNNTLVTYSNVSRTSASSGVVPPNPYGWFNGSLGGNPDSDQFPADLIRVTVGDNVLAGFKEITYFSRPWIATTDQYLSIDEIWLPGINPNVPAFAPKSPLGSVLTATGGAGLPMYANRAFWQPREDNNKGGVGTFVTNIQPTGHASEVFMTPQTNMQPELIGRAGASAYPLQHEWTTASALTIANYGTTGGGGGGGEVVPEVDTTNPTITLSPSASNFSQAGTLTLIATPADAGGISKVEFYKAGVLLSTVSAAPYVLSRTITAADNGTTQYSAKAFDAAGNNSTAQTSVVVAIETVQRTITVKLTDGAQPTPGLLPNLTGLRVAVFSKATVDTLEAPIFKASGYASNAQANVVIQFQTALPVGTMHWVEVSESDGTATQTPSPRGYAGPAQST